ncbi:monooxygenase hypC [Colletotrichum spaethianum]|uniref:Monooxygenase hypC n=1 Tax=Colletotrichum spaethianum TaxID=700344 RepID=A0AA37L4Z3_9PEZI|nr:monooxygenase hypC [Colletotrichum spaethianum]GKT41836.1 monooxygenase hypC [Colletotrichum spaethianum]
MSQLGLTNTIATATGILGCAWWAGATASLSMFSVPAILPSAGSEPAHALRQWQHIFLSGASTGPKVALVTFLTLAYSAYDRRSQGVAWKPYATAAALGLAIVPFTLIFMSPTNSALMAGAQGVKTLGSSETTELLTRWRALNFVRSLFSLAGAGVGLWYAVSQ